MKPREIICLGSRILVGSVLIHAGFMKAVGPAAEFAAMIAAYQIVPASWATPLSVALPYVEMWAGLFVLFGLFTRQAALATATLFSVFLLAILSALLRKIDLVSCGCFGPDSLSPRHTLIMDAVLLALAILIYRQAKYPPSYSLDSSL